MAEPDLLDRRQRRAAALLLCAIDLPAPMFAMSKQLIEAARVCPGITVDQVCLNSRRAALERAQQLISELLSETL